MNKSFKKSLALSTLTDKDLGVYSTLLRNQGFNISELARVAGIERLSCYRVILKLAKLNLIFPGLKGKRRIWFARPGGYFLKQIKGAFVRIKEAYRRISLNTSPRQSILKFEHFKGSQLKNLYHEIVNENKGGILLAVLPPKSINFFFTPNDYLKLLRKRIKNRTMIKVLMSKIDPNLPGFKIGEDWEKLRLIKLTGHEKFPLTAVFEISRNKLIIIPQTDKGTAEAIVIENKEVATTFKSLFELAYRGLKSYQPQINN